MISSCMCNRRSTSAAVAVVIVAVLLGLMFGMTLILLVQQQHDTAQYSRVIEDLSSSSLWMQSKPRGLLLQYNRYTESEEEEENPKHDTTRRLQQLVNDPGTSDNEQNHQQQQQQQPPVDATFNGLPLYYHEGKTPRSSVSCIEEGRAGALMPRNVSWMFRSCRFEHLCFDVNRQDYVVFRGSSSNNSDNDDNNINALLPPDNWTLSVALGGINPRWMFDQRGFDKGAWKVRWFPTILNSSTIVSGYYMLPDSHVLAPFHSFAGHNVGHLLWDDFYPLYSLLRIFNLLPQQQATAAKSTAPSSSPSPLSSRIITKIVPIRQRLSQQLYATCDIRKNKRKQCANNFERFLPLMGVDPTHFSTTKDFRLETAGQQQEIKSSFVCAKTAVAGLGMLTDHGLRDHGWVVENKKSSSSSQPPPPSSWSNNNALAATEQTNSLVAQQAVPPHNLGRGANFAAFSRFLVHNLLDHDVVPLPSLAVAKSSTGERVAAASASRRTPIQVTFSILSSRDWDRRLNFTSQVRYLQEHWNDGYDDDDEQDDSGNNNNRRLPPLRVETHALWEMTLKEQVALAQRSHVFVTVCGGGSMTATFLPPSSSLIVYYNPTGGFDFQSYTKTGLPARLDWDLLNNAAHLKVHWLPIPMEQENGSYPGDSQEDDLELLLALIQHEAIVLTQESSSHF